MWAQKAKANWLKLGDRNTIFFQTVATIRRKRNEIKKVKDRNGLWWNATEGLEQVFVPDFMLCFSTSPSPSSSNLNSYLDVVHPCINGSDNAALLQPVGHIEIWEAVSSIRALKALEPNGIGVDFYHECWDIVKDSVSPMIKDFFLNNLSLRLINHTNIAFIPKVEFLETVGNYKTISLCNVSYKNY